jgi:hypothetical protein
MCEREKERETDRVRAGYIHRDMFLCDVDTFVSYSLYQLTYVYVYGAKYIHTHIFMCDAEAFRVWGLGFGV